MCVHHVHAWYLNRVSDSLHEPTDDWYAHMCTEIRGQVWEPVVSVLHVGPRA